MNRLQRSLSLAVSLAAIGVLVTLTVAQPLHAQSGGWTAPELVFEGSGTVNYATLVSDPYGQVHAFWLFSEQEFGAPSGNSIFYSRLDDPEWQPLDILLVPGTGVGLTSAASSRGLSLLWEGRNWSEAGPAPEHTAKDWSGPVNLQAAYQNAGLATAPDGALWMAYGATTGEIDVVRQDPATGQWGAAKLVGDTAGTNAAADWLKMAISPDGTLHVVWSEFQLPNGWPPLGLYYAQSTDGGVTWTGRRRLADGGYNQPNVIAGQNGDVYLTWTGIAGVGGKYFQESHDGGVTWSDVTAILPANTGGGSEGSPNLAIDSAGGLHLIYSNNHCVWYVSRAPGQDWSEPECISQGAGPAQVLESPAMTIRLGNELHVIFWVEFRTLWHTSLTLDLPAETPLPIPVRPTATPIPPTATLAPTVTPTPLPDFGPAPTAEMVTGPGLFSVVAGTIPVILLVAFVILGRRRGDNRK